MPRPFHPARGPRRLAAVLAGIAVAVAAAGCSLLPAGLVPAAGDAPLVTLELHGGECPGGGCRFTADIYRDGRVIRSDGQPQVVDAPSLVRLVEQVERTDWDATLATPFEGDCPTAYDGQEEVYTFHPGGEPVVVASCTVVVRHDREPFQTVQGILFGLGG
jgi:hypothetical protein